jgi:hypothetical protein
MVLITTPITAQITALLTITVLSYHHPQLSTPLQFGPHRAIVVNSQTRLMGQGMDNVDTVDKIKVMMGLGIVIIITVVVALGML